MFAPNTDQMSICLGCPEYFEQVVNLGVGVVIWPLKAIQFTHH